MAETVFDGLQEFIDAAIEVDEYRIVEGVDWNLELGALYEVTAESFTDPPLLIFDNIKDYPKGFRVVSFVTNSKKRAALAFGLPPEKSRAELRELMRERMKNVKPIPPVEVATGEVMQNVMTGEDIDLWKFPVPRYHADDGGRYIGTGDTIINRDPDTGFINVGTYRVEVHEKNLLGLWMSPGQDGRLICQRYWERGESCPIVAVFGGDPLSFMGGFTKIPYGRTELEYIGGLRGRPLEVIPGPVTGLPIPAHAEIAIEGEVPPPSVEARNEGPFGEWPGYYSGGSLGTGEPQPVIRVKAIYHRNNPIIHNSAPLWPGVMTNGLGFGEDGVARLEAAGIPDVVGVASHSPYVKVVAINQRYAGHAKRAALAAASGMRNGRWIVIVDEDIDPTDWREVMWAMTTRCDPKRDIEVIDGAWSTPLDPLVSSDPEKKESGDHTNSLAVFYACRPFHLRDSFPKVSRSPRALRQQVVAKYRSAIGFPED
jgi:4-hydroxy-3-polyprenylbenzoate decarboxylase